MQTIEQLLYDLGYRQIYNVAGQKSIASLFKGKRRCGVYVLHLENQEYYVGQATNIVRRFSEHRRDRFPQIVWLSFKPVPQELLDEVEDTDVNTLQRAGVPLHNVNIVSFTWSVRPFDDVMPKNVQQRWLEDIHYVDLSGQRVNDDELRRKYRNKFNRLFQHPAYNEVVDVLAQYIVSCIPKPKQTEVSYWSISSMIGDQWLVRVNVGPQVVFDVLEEQGAIKYRFAIFQTDAERLVDSPLEWGDDLTTEIADQTNGAIRYWVYKSALTKAGSDQAFVLAHSTEDAFALLEDVLAVKSMAKLNLGLCQKGPCLWGRNHCLDLADAIFARIDG